MKKKVQQDAKGVYHAHICKGCDGLGRVVRVLGHGRLEQVKCEDCDGKGGR